MNKGKTCVLTKVEGEACKGGNNVFLSGILEELVKIFCQILTCFHKSDACEDQIWWGHVVLVSWANRGVSWAGVIQAWEWMFQKKPENVERSDVIRFVREANEQSSWGVWGRVRPSLEHGNSVSRTKNDKNDNFQFHHKFAPPLQPWLEKILKFTNPKWLKMLQLIHHGWRKFRN